MDRAKSIAAIVMVMLGMLAPRRGAAEEAGDTPVEAPWGSKDAPPSRAFLATSIEAGVPYATPAVFAGYGKPHWQWAGLEARASTTTSYASAYAGLHGALPFLDASIGVRDTYSYARSMLDVRRSHPAEDVQGARSANARYLTLDLDVNGVVPCPGGYVLFELYATRTLDAPPNRDLFEESLRAIMRTPMAGVGRLAYAGRIRRWTIGPLGEAAVLPYRAGPVVRAGLIGGFQWTTHLEALLVLSAPVASPDHLDFLDASSGIIGLRYRWSTGERAPGFP